jgi:septum formation protein
MLQRPVPRLILASASASRRTVLEAAGLTFAVRPAPIDEAGPRQAAGVRGDSPGEAALVLAGLNRLRKNP